ncbi:hypothetical protein [Ensifer sp. LBL]|uniref:hypothetical protein n=1 Tax=Ensifer sp. LBL TaxID=2991056 RepID=UPI003D19CA60
MFWGKRSLPAEFDAKVYRKRYPDLRHMSAESAEAHYRDCGLEEGRCPSRVTSRLDFIGLVDRKKPVLEIGPFLNPCLRRPVHNVKYFDVLNKEQIVSRAQHILTYSEEEENRRQLRAAIEAAEEIDFSHPTGDLSSVPERFMNVFSSHCIEHQVDIIRHLNGVFDLLEPGGRYFVIAPDKRYCFDHFHPESRFIDALAAYLEVRQFHTPTKVLEHAMNLTHNDPGRHWAGDHGSRRIDNCFFDERPGVFENVLDQARLAKDQYIDVHNWIFTPSSFREVMRQLFDRGFVKMPVVKVYPTLRNSMEFYAVFEKPA